MSSFPPHVIVLIGPTASGKTELAIEIAEHFKTRIHNIDSRQIYKSMNIGTAKPTENQQGRIKHFLSAFGEHVISEEVEKAMQAATKLHNVAIREFTVAPNINPIDMLPHHEWYVEFENFPEDMSAFTKSLDNEMIHQNIYYKELIDGKILKSLEVISVEIGGFNNYMKSIGRLGGQNKVPRLSNDRKIADKLKK